MNEPWEPGFPGYDAWESRETKKYWRDKAKGMTADDFAKFEHPALDRPSQGGKREATATDDPDLFVIDFADEFIPKWFRRRVRAARSRALVRRSPSTKRAKTRHRSQARRRTRQAGRGSSGDSGRSDDGESDGAENHQDEPDGFVLLWLGDPLDAGGCGPFTLEAEDPS